jgi:DNA invertase Pin-like site-specific DNA recombinase
MGTGHNIRVVYEYIDDGVSGTAFFDDRGGKELLADGRAGLFDVMLIRDVDRLCRDESVRFQAFAAIKGAGLRLMSINEGLDIRPDADESDDLNMGICILFAAQDRKLTLRKLSQRRDSGPPPGGGRMARCRSASTLTRPITSSSVSGWSPVSGGLRVT